MKYVLVTMPHCPKCDAVKRLLAKTNIQYNTINGLENVDLINKYDIKSAPTWINTETETATPVAGFTLEQLQDLAK